MFARGNRLRPAKGLQAMNALAALLILAIGADAPTDRRPVDANEVFAVDFAADADVNYDDWPDGWTRRLDEQHPPYLAVGIVDDPTASDGRSLRVDLDGGAAAVYSPPVAVGSESSYLLEGALRTAGLEFDEAYMAVTFYTADRQPLETHHSAKFTTTEGWQRVRVGPVAPESEEVAIAVIALHVRPTEEADLTGSVWFDDIWMARLPRMTLEANRRHHLYHDPNEIEVTCRASGMMQNNPLLRFELLDYRGNLLDFEELPMTESAGPRSPMSYMPADAAGGREAVDITWRPPLDEFGYFRVRAVMYRRGVDGEISGVMHEQETSLVVVPRATPPRSGEFGWTLLDGEHPLALTELPALLSQSGVNWVKVPVWHDSQDQSRSDRLAWLAERLSAQRIELVGLLSDPPQDVLEQFEQNDGVLAAGIFAEDDLWRMLLEPVTTRLSLKIRWWQLGDDGDTSFVGYPGLDVVINDVRDELHRFGQEIHIGFPWNWVYPDPVTPSPPWDFLSYTSPLPLTADETRAYLGQLGGPTRRWMSLEPLPRDSYLPEERVRDLVERMIVAKIMQADAVFVPNVFDTERGLMNDDVTPGELFAPWRTTALMLAGAEYLGSLQLPGGSDNHLFTRGGETIMVVWNASPTTEEIYLGENIQEVDVWGRVHRAETRDGKQVIHTDQFPKFFTGVNRQIAQVRLSLEFDQQRLANVFSRPQRLALRFDNPFSQGVAGEVHISAPEDWNVSVNPRLEVSAGGVANIPVEVLLRGDATSGQRPIRIDLALNGDRNYEFSVYRELQVGLGDIELELRTRVDEHGDLVVEQLMSNHTDDSVSFNCYLFAPERRRMRQQVVGLNRGLDKRTFLVPHAAELDGATLWLRAEEIDGDRVLNYRFEVRL